MNYSWRYSGQTEKHRKCREILEKYIQENNGYLSCFTSWVSYAKEFREGRFSSIAYGNDEQLERFIREFCENLVAKYSFTDGSTLKRDLLAVFDETKDLSSTASSHNLKKANLR